MGMDPKRVKVVGVTMDLSCQTVRDEHSSSSTDVIRYFKLAPYPLYVYTLRRSSFDCDLSETLMSFVMLII